MTLQNFRSVNLKDRQYIGTHKWLFIEELFMGIAVIVTWLVCIFRDGL